MRPINAAGTRQKSKLLKRAFSNLLFLTLSWSQIPIQIPAGFSNELILNRDNAKAEKREARVREEKKQEAEEEALNAEMIACWPPSSPQDWRGGLPDGSRYSQDAIRTALELPGHPEIPPSIQKHLQDAPRRLQVFDF